MVEQKIKMYQLPKALIFADTREFSSGVVEELSRYECIVKEKMLRVADYLCSDRIGIERKTAKDFVQSIMDRRLFEQAINLKNNFEKPIIIVEGNNLNELYDNGRTHPNMIRGALASLAVDFSIPILWTRDEKETAGLVFWLAKKEQFDEKREVSIRGSAKSKSHSEQQEFLVAGLPNISTTRARNLLSYFKTPEKVFSAGIKELAEVEGIGEKTAENIRTLLGKEYERKEKKK